MGLYDSVMVMCPDCGMEHEFQSKSGPCLCDTYTLDGCPDDVLENINRHAPIVCDCGSFLYVNKSTREVLSGNNFNPKETQCTGFIVFKNIGEEWEQRSIVFETIEEAMKFYKKEKYRADLHIMGRIL